MFSSVMSVVSRATAGTLTPHARALAVHAVCGVGVRLRAGRGGSKLLHFPFEEAANAEPAYEAVATCEFGHIQITFIFYYTLIETFFLTKHTT